MSKVSGSHASKRESAIVRPSIRRSVVPNSGATTDTDTDVAKPMAGLIVDDGSAYVQHDNDGDTGKISLRNFDICRQTPHTNFLH